MFKIDAKGNIKISRGDSAAILTCPGRILEDGTSEQIILTDNARVIFTVRSCYSGKLLIRRILTSENYINGALRFMIKSYETDVDPNGYNYSFMYIPDITNNDEAYTYAEGRFEIIPSVSAIEDIERGNL